jgi:hypothetical protein
MGGREMAAPSQSLSGCCKRGRRDTLWRLEL